MTVRFNPKQYLGRKRITIGIRSCPGVEKILTWDASRGQYCPPPRGKNFIARRYEMTSSHTRKRIKKSFETLEEAREWLRKLDLSDSAPPMPNTVNEKQDFGPTFAEVYQDFYRRKVTRLASGTQVNYDRYIRLHFQEILPLPVRLITAKVIDVWLQGRREAIVESTKAKQRVSFEHELSVLRTVLKFYDEYYDDPLFRYPVKARHSADAKVGKSKPKNKDLKVDEFWRFQQELCRHKNGKIMAAMAVVQYFQALRVSEVAGLFFEDVSLNFSCREHSVIRVCRHVVYPHKGGLEPKIEFGFKNAQGGDRSVKELYLFPESFEALRSVYKVGGRGLIFGNSSIEPFTYRQIQKAYDDAFRAAKLPYTGTHVLRHGGCRSAYNATGDLAIAQQLLGNSNLESTLVYAKRDKGALKKFVSSRWANQDPNQQLATNGHT